MLHFLPTYTIGDLINTLLFVLALVGLYLTVHQIRQGYQIQKATFFKDLYLAMISEKDQKDAFYLIIHNKFVYDANFKGSETEKHVDALLCFFDLACGLYAGGVLTKQEMYYFEYAFRKVYINPGIQNYLDYLGKVFRNAGAKVSPFAAYILYCQKELHITNVTN